MIQEWVKSWHICTRTYWSSIGKRCIIFSSQVSFLVHFDRDILLTRVVWKKFFDCTWKTYKTRFSGLIENMYQHRTLIERQANMSEIEESRKAREESNTQLTAILEGQEQTRRDAVRNWLRPASFESDQNYYSGIRAEYPNTGKWLLDHENFKLWFDPRFPSIPPLLWLNGFP